MIGANESWVTLATNDVTGWQAIILARSIRRSLTTRKLTVLVSENVSWSLKYVLQQEYDLVIRFDNSELSLKNGYLKGTPTKILCWNLLAWKKCVFIDSNSLVMDNCDELFRFNEFSGYPNSKNGKMDTNVFIYRPARKTFEGLLERAEQNNKVSENELFNEFFKESVSNKRHHLNACYNTMFDEIQPDVMTNMQPKVIRFKDVPWALDFKKERDILPTCLSLWRDIYYGDLLPKIDKMKKTEIRKFMDESIVTHRLPPRNGVPKNTHIEIPDELKDSIAVVGMSCRFPGANSPDEFWNLLKEGKDPIRSYPMDRPNAGQNEEELRGAAFRAGFLSCPIDEFDAKFFGISPREAPFVDPQQRLLLEVTWESLENSGINPQNLKETDTGVFMGIWQQDYDHYLPNIGLKANDFHHRYLGNAFSATASRTSYYLGLNGPSLALESGCSSASCAVHLSCESLRRGEIGLAIASGVNLVLMVLNPMTGDDKETVVLSNDFHCKTFDESADGFVRAEGCGVVVLKRYADAIRDGDNICALIRGNALNNDGAGTSFGTPNARAQERVIREALESANCPASEISYVEAHGTGTIVGDPIEMYAIGQAYSEGRTEPLIVSSVKTNIGHAEAAAGIAGLIKTILCIKNKAIPPHLHLKNLNPRINLDAIPAKVPMELMDWNAEKRIAGVSSFSMSGTNVHLIVQEPPERNEFIYTLKKNRPQVVTISAKSEEALEALRLKYLEFLESNSNINLDDLAYSTNTCRAHLSNRIAVVAKDISQLISKLEKRGYSGGKIPPQKPKVAFLFTGQGSQYFQMAKGLYNFFPAFHIAFDCCDYLFRQSLGKSLQDVCWNDSRLLEKSIYCQPAIFCIEYALMKLWKYFGITPDYVLGHSVGEFCAAVCADILSLQDAMKLVIERSRLVNALPGGSMAAIKDPYDKVCQTIDKFHKKQSKHHIDIAAINSLEEVVVSGSTASMNEFLEYCNGLGIKSQSIPASHAFHSREMDPVLKEFGKIASTVTCKEPKCTYISGTLAKKMEVEEFGTEYWQRHLRDTVRFTEAIKTVWSECKVLVEIGAQPILLGLAMANITDGNGSFCPSIRRAEEDWFTVFTTISKLHVAGLDIDWSKWFGNYHHKIPLPNYPFQRQKYWFFDEEVLYASGIKLTTKMLHPLLGRQIPAPLNDSVFSNTIKVKELQYVEDHKVAERIILPGACYLETIMAAGREALQGCGVLVPLTVENLSVEAALELDKPIQVQTVVKSTNVEDGLEYHISIHRQLVAGEADKWKRHAQATFAPNKKLPEVTPIDLEKLKETLTLKESVDKAYAKIAEIGIQFGPKFQSIAKAWSGPTEILTEIPLPEDFQEYICHPIVLDAMIQTFAFRFALSANSDQKDLQLPIGIKRFVWLSRAPANIVYAHASWENGGSNVNLYNGNGDQLAIMEGLDLLRTTVDSFIRSLISENAILPDFLTETWRPQLAITANRVNPMDMVEVEFTSKYTGECMERVNAFEAKEWLGYQDVNKMFFFFLCRSVQECAFPWPVGKELQAEEWINLLPNTIQAVKIVHGFFDTFRREDYVTINPETGGATILKPLLTIDECEKELKRLLESAEKHCENDDVIFRFANRIGQHMTQVFQGKMTPLPLLFPEDKNETGASKIYSDSRWYILNTELAIAVVSDTLTPFAEKGKGKLRILEVGAGTGASSIKLIERLNDMGVNYDYTFTDISPLFLAEARKKLGGYITFELLNVEEDPLAQGFPPEQFDIVIGMQVIHATSDLTRSLTNIRKLLKKDGALVLLEQFESEYFLSLSFGLLDGWWCFKDFRKLSPIVTSDEWSDCLRKAGFDRIKPFPMYENTNGALVARASHASVFQEPPEPEEEKTWIIFTDNSNLCKSVISKVNETKRHVITVTLDFSKNAQTVYNEDGTNVTLNGINDADFKLFFENLDKTKKLETIVFAWTEPKHDTPIEETQRRLCAGLLHLIQSFLVHAQGLPKPKPKFVFLTRGVNYVGDCAAGNPVGGAGIGMLKTFCNENPELLVQTLDTDQNEVVFETEVMEVFSHLWSKQKEQFVALREGKKFVQRLTVPEKRGNTVQLPNSDRYKVINPESGAFNDIEVGIVPKLEVVDDHLELAVRATSLNFRDLFMVLKPEGFTIPKNVNVDIGMDISGVVTAIGPNVTRFKVGDEVFGFTAGGGLASHAVVSERIVMKKPKYMTFEGASTIPCAFLTAYYSLINVAKLKKEDRVLIHVATGGVGLAAIQVVKHIGAEIYATAGSHRKRAYLRNLGIKYVYHSRNTNFGTGIEKDTKGAGVTVVLNSLTGTNFKETSLNACAKGARFVEIAKLNIWKEEEVQELRPDVDYTIVDLAAKTEEAPRDLQDMFKEIEGYFDRGIYNGLACTSFPLELVRDAFYYFQEAKHIGKVCIKMPLPTITPEGRLKLHHEIFNAASSYLITGGLGGLGLEVTKWMAKNGAKHIALAGRSPPSPKAQELIDSLIHSGINLLVLQADVAEYEQCKHLLDAIQRFGLPPLRGIIHAAGVISDAVVPNQSWEKYKTVLKPKVFGGWHLHNLTKDYEMEFFVMFSSGAAIFGVMGQSNHSAANRFLDSLTHYRQSLGLKSQTINWGAWSDVGAAAHIKLGQEGAIGMRSFTPARGIAALEKIMRENTIQSVVLDVIDWNIVKQFVTGLGMYLEEMRSDKSSMDNFSEEYNKMIEEIKASPPEERQEKIQNFLEQILKQTLRIPENEKIDPDQNFSELGVDSLMAMEMRNRLQGMLGDKTLTVSSLQENRTLRSLSTHMANLMNSDGEAEANIPELLKLDTVLPPDIAIPEIKALKPSQFKHILLTGGTGFLGSHFLPELSQANLFVTCIIRAKDQDEAELRLIKTLKKSEIENKVDMSRVCILLGDVSKDHFGLDEDVYNNLAQEVDAIVHCAIKSNHMEGYAEGGANSLRQINVFGTLNIIKFASTTRGKHILYSSTLLVTPKATEDRQLVEEFPDSDDTGEKITNGYILSKFVAEKLLNQAMMEREIPVTCLRYVQLFGNTETGYIPAGSNHAWMIFLSCIRVRKFPSLNQNGIPIQAVDEAVKVSMKLFLNDHSDLGIYNLTSSSKVDEEDIRETFSKFGVEGEFLPFKEWRDLVFEEMDLDKNLMAPLAILYGDDEKSNTPNYLGFHPLADQLEVLEGNTLSPKVQKNLPDAESYITPAKIVLEKHLDHYYKNLGKDPPPKQS